MEDGIDLHSQVDEVVALIDRYRADAGLLQDRRGYGGGQVELRNALRERLMVDPLLQQARHAGFVVAERKSWTQREYYLSHPELSHSVRLVVLRGTGHVVDVAWSLVPTSSER